MGRFAPEDEGFRGARRPAAIGPQHNWVSGACTQAGGM